MPPYAAFIVKIPLLYMFNRQTLYCIIHMTIKALLVVMVFTATIFQGVRAQNPSSTADSPATIVGKWSGTFEGAASGKFELVINQDSNGKLAGQVIMLTDDGSRQPIDLKTITWGKGQLAATYNDPNDGDDEVNFTGTYAKPALKGTWKSDGGQATGTWQVTR